MRPESLTPNVDRNDMKKAITLSTLSHLLIACLLPVALGAYFVASGTDWDHGFTGATFLLFSGILPVVFVFLGEHSPFFAPVVISLRLAVVLRYPFRTYRAPDSRMRMYVENMVLTLLTAAFGYFIMFASRQ